jgi:hypothetical protein
MEQEIALLKGWFEDEFYGLDKNSLSGRVEELFCAAIIGRNTITAGESIEWTLNRNIRS